MLDFNRTQNPQAQQLMALCSTALKFATVAELGTALLDQLQKSEAFSDVQKMAFELVVAEFRNRPESPEAVSAILQFILYGDWPISGGVKVGSLSREQREGIVIAVAGVSKAILTQAATNLNELAAVEVSIPKDWETYEEFMP